MIYNHKTIILGTISKAFLGKAPKSFHSPRYAESLLSTNKARTLMRDP